MSNSSEELYHKFPFPFPLFSRGRLGKGGNWKNIKETNDYSNLNLVFIDGTKSDFTLPPIEKNNVLKRLPPSYLSQSVNDFYSVSESKFASKSAVMKPSRHNKFHQHAKQGFEYWPQDKLLKQQRAKNSAKYTTGAFKTFFGLGDSSLKL